MARLDVFALSDTGLNYVVDVQAELVSDLSTRVVIPLQPVADAGRPITDLNPVFDILGSPHVLVTQALASIPRAELRRRVMSLDYQHDLIVRALDILFIGF